MPAAHLGQIDQALSDVSIRYSNDQFIAEQVFPILPVDSETGLVFKFDKENLRTPQTSIRGDFARAERIDYGLSTVPYGPLLEHSLEVPISQRTLDMYKSPLKPETNATNTATEKLQIEKEIGLANFLGTSSNLTQKVTLSGTSQWSDYTGTSNPIKDIQTGHTVILKGSLKKANTVAMGREVFDGLLNHPQILDRIKYTARPTTAELTNAIADLFGVKKVLIGEAVHNNAAEGLTDANAFVWGKHVFLLYVADTPGVEEVSAGYHLTLNGKRFVDKWYETPIKSQIIRANDFYTRFVMANECIYGIYNAVA